MTTDAAYLVIILAPFGDYRLGRREIIIILHRAMPTRCLHDFIGLSGRGVMATKSTRRVFADAALACLSTQGGGPTVDATAGPASASNHLQR